MVIERVAYEKTDICPCGIEESAIMGDLLSIYAEVLP